MKKKLAFVLSGGGSHGALQVGALHALWEMGLSPDLLIGSSIGAVNSAFLAYSGFSNKGLDLLSKAWEETINNDLLPSKFLWLTARAIIGHSSICLSQQIRSFLISHGLNPEIRFRDIKEPSVIIISSDLNTGSPVLHGLAEDEKVLDAIMLSTTLPPWVMPSRKEGRYLLDGGVVSHLPIEPAINAGATEIVALDLSDMREMVPEENRIGYLLDRLTSGIERRQAYLEIELANARGIPVTYINLIGKDIVPFWDFHHSSDLISQGYQITRQAIEINSHKNN